MTMHAMKTTLSLFLCVLLACVVAHGQETNKAGTTAAQFLKIGVGARGTAMAGAVSAVIDDASALYWNPAGLLELSRLSLHATHTKWIADIDHEYAGLVVPVGDNSRLGISATLLTVGEIEITRPPMWR
jgi:long-subunit fatty acid transport protein